MNDRMQELAEQADLLGEFTPTRTAGRYVGYINVGDIEKFADLIVRECINALAAEIVYNENYTERNKVIGDMMIVVKKHFGAEQ